MIFEKVHLNKFYKLENDPILEVMYLDGLDNQPVPQKRRTVLVVPGGAYMFCSKREGEPVAAAFAIQGFSTFILWYTTTDKNEDVCYPTQTKECLCAMDYIRKNADKYGVLKDSVAIVGFSAGGHLTASYAYLYKNKELLDAVGVTEGNAKPNALGLCYPVITMKENSHKETKEIVTRNDPDLIKLLSCEDHVDKDYPKTYIWCTDDDAGVPPCNTEMMNDALEKAGVEHIMRKYPFGNHGLSIATDLSASVPAQSIKEVSGWVDECAEFFKKVM